MPLTSRKARPLDRTEAVRDARLIVIAAEGERSEEIYFEIFHSTKVKIEILPCVDGKSDPVATLARLNDYRSEYELGGDDELWLVIDRDRWTPKALAGVARLCRSQRVNLAMSNPCFEVWLALHYVEQIPARLQSNASERFFRNLHGSYRKGKFDPAPLLPRVRAAIRNADALDEPKGLRWPVGPGSHVYLLMQSIVAAGVKLPN